MGFETREYQEMSTTNRAITNRSYKDVPFLEGDDLESPEVFLKKMNRFIDSYNFLSKYLSLSKNFNATILEIEFLSGEQKIISHLLGVRPKYRIILRQEGNGVLSDIPSDWNDKTATIKNNGAVTVKATIQFLKE